MNKDYGDVRSLKIQEVAKLDEHSFRAMLGQLIELQEVDRKEWQLLYYKPVNEKALAIHMSSAKTVGVGGGNRSSKTETCLSIMSILGTGVIPICFRDNKEQYEHILSQMRGPVSMRLVCESLTTVMHPIMLPKLRWNSWTGIDRPGGARGHWGWIPRRCLIGGSWDKSWSEKLRTLRFYHLDPENYDNVLGESSIQIMSYDQDPEDFASGDFHMILHDETPSWPIWRENEARAMGVDGRNFLAMTWRDDPSINVDWLFDEVYEKGQFGSPGKHKDVDWFNLWSTENPHLDQDAVSEQASKWGKEMTRVRVYGETIRFSNLIHPGFHDFPRVWCFTCKADVNLVKGKCPDGCTNVCAYTHVEHLEWHNNWPVVWLLDPHPRKPHMFMWVGITPNDDWHVLRSDEVEGDPTAVANHVLDIEREYQWAIAKRMIDPNMARQVAGMDREIVWQDEFDRAGLVTDLADNSAVGRKRVDTMLAPDEGTYRPRLTFEPGDATAKAVHHMKRYMWSDFSLRLDRDQKQTPRDKYDDFPTLLKYLANDDPSFDRLAHGSPILQRAVRGFDNTKRSSIWSKDRTVRR